VILEGVHGHIDGKEGTPLGEDRALEVKDDHEGADAMDGSGMFL
jgi:hypothetical protein